MFLYFVHLKQRNLLPERNNFDEEEMKQWAINNAATFLEFLDFKWQRGGNES